MDNTENRVHPLSIFLIFLRLGLTSFGGPVAHLGYFREEFVNRRKWLSDANYADLVALCQFLPGPASSQVGIALGVTRSGYSGALAAWVGFTLPSALMMTLTALGLAHFGDSIPLSVLQGLKIAAVAIVAHALWGMAQSLCRGKAKTLLMLLSALTVLLLPVTWGQVAVIGIAAIVGRFLFKTEPQLQQTHFHVPISQRSGVLWLVLFLALLLALPTLQFFFPQQWLAVVDAFYRAGALVFGGGHVVLPLLQSEVVATGWVSETTFLAGYGTAQAVPGPLFTFAAFLGASINGWAGALLCLVAMFLSSFLLVFGALPFWQTLRTNTTMQASLSAVNAAVVGLLLAAFYNPVWTSSITNAQSLALALAAFIALKYWKLSPWLLVLLCGFISWVITLL
ncbi:MULTISPECIES: chromate efflux transporter [Gammaproteobacteria]|uniref:chromate efflux transporter n=1 Tax=Gammaproteobacteria TaxID=1236 RepID=UPI000DD0D8BF|nr:MULTISPECIES: chromate efflux transporter [Gammaproteobacteria]RTE86691.1 chromate efflux transporter [Aliidiomarina sp. B3213]TCZ90755.1 chromate efflux transporter [Lysobacter sp. N42]